MSKAKSRSYGVDPATPGRCYLEDIQYHLYVREKAERALRDLKSRRTLSHKAVERRIEKWLMKGALV